MMQITRDKVFLEGISMDELIQKNALSKFEGSWNIIILVPSGMTASLASSSVYAIITWLEVYADSKLYDLTVAQSPDDVWSVSLQEKIHDEL